MGRDTGKTWADVAHDLLQDDFVRFCLAWGGLMLLFGLAAAVPLWVVGVAPPAPPPVTAGTAK